MFGPGGKLYIGTGDSGGQGDALGSAQKLSTLLGKTLNSAHELCVLSQNGRV
jgi:glucose/arabinose dehydrogenase